MAVLLDHVQDFEPPPVSCGVEPEIKHPGLMRVYGLDTSATGLASGTNCSAVVSLQVICSGV